MGAVALALSAVAQTRTLTEDDIPSVLRSLTTEQKARLVVGTHHSEDAPSHYTPGAAGWTYAIPEKGVPGLNLADGPVGPRINPMPWVVTRVAYDDNGLPHDEVTGEDADGRRAE